MAALRKLGRIGHDRRPKELNLVHLMRDQNRK
jgi:hypothetical protein